MPRNSLDPDQQRRQDSYDVFQDRKKRHVQGLRDQTLRDLVNDGYSGEVRFTFARGRGSITGRLLKFDTTYQQVLIRTQYGQEVINLNMIGAIAWFDERKARK